MFIWIANFTRIPKENERFLHNTGACCGSRLRISLNIHFITYYARHITLNILHKFEILI